MITYEMIFDAVNGDPEAMTKIITQYQNYINMLSTKKINNNGCVEYILDVDLQDQLISKMIEITLGFDPYPKYSEDV